MADINGLISDPEFAALTVKQQKQLLTDFDPEFGNLSELQIRQYVKPGREASLNPNVGQFAPSKFTPTQLAAVSLGNPISALVNRQLQGRPVTQMEAAAEAGLEEIVRLPGQLGEVALTSLVPSPVRLLSGAAEASGIVPEGTLQNFIKKLVRPATQAPEIIEEFLDVERGSERAKFRAPEGAAAGEIGAQFFPPVAAIPKAPTVLAKAIYETAGALIPKATSDNAARLVRSALKPSNANVGNRLERAASESLEDIFLSNPNADKAGEMAIEGFSTEVTKLRKGIGSEIGEISSLQKGPLTTADDIASALNKRADDLERAGQPQSKVQALRDRASNFQGKQMQIADIQEATTIANRENGPLFKRTREMSNPLLADVDTMANQIISEVGGSGINRVLESLAGPRGLELRKKWSNLRTIEDQAEKRLNQLINDAPAEARPAIISALTSLEGIAGLAAFASGLKSGGAIALAAVGAKKWIKKSDNLLKDSNEKIKRVYEQFRRSPPSKKPPVKRTLSPEEIPPTIEEVYNLRAAQSGRPSVAIPETISPEVLQELAQRELAVRTSPLPIGAPQILPAVERPTLSEIIQRSRTAAQQELQNRALQQQILKSIEDQRYLESLAQQPF